MAEWVDVIIILFVLTFIALIIWSRVQNQRMYDTIMEIRDIIRDVASENPIKKK